MEKNDFAEATYQKVERLEGQDVRISVMDTSDVHPDAQVGRECYDGGRGGGKRDK